MKTLMLAALCALAVPALAGGADPADDKAVMATLEAMAEATIGKDAAVSGDHDLGRAASR